MGWVGEQEVSEMLSSRMSAEEEDAVQKELAALQAEQVRFFSNPSRRVIAHSVRRRLQSRTSGFQMLRRSDLFTCPRRQRRSPQPKVSLGFEDYAVKH